MKKRNERNGLRIMESDVYKGKWKRNGIVRRKWRYIVDLSNKDGLKVEVYKIETFYKRSP